VEIVTVAMDTGGADDARPWIEAAKSEHPALIDRAHILGDLLGIVNVPNSVWIDEHGMIVRPAEPVWPGRNPLMDQLPKPEDLPEHLRPVFAEVAKMRTDPALSLAMMMDWADHGSQSRYALAPDEVIARSLPRGNDEASAAAHFELGQYLYLRGDTDGAIEHWREAHRLDVTNWTYKRQAWHFASPGATGIQMPGYDTNWLDDVRSMGAENYYPEVVP
jgi:hypothetical protein